MHIRFFLVAVLGLIVACGGDRPRGPTGPTGGTIVVNALGDAQVLLPALVRDETSRMIVDQVFDHLADISPDLNSIGDHGFTPRLARRWTWAPDSLSIAFELDPRARWHDGRAVTARDVRFTFDVIADPGVGSPVAGLVTNIDSVSVRDSLTAVVWFKRRAAEQFYEAAYQLLIVPEHVYGAVPRDQLRTADVVRRPVGSGRFRLARWEPGVRLELVADTANYFGRSNLDRVIVSVAHDPGTGAAQVMAGQSDFIPVFVGELEQLEASSVARPIPNVAMAYTFMGFNLYDQAARTRPHPIFGDARVRRAFSLAVDRQGMLQNVFGTAGSLGHGPFPAGHAAADTTLPVPRHDVAAARALLDSAGWREPRPGAIRQRDGRPLRITLLLPAVSALRVSYAVMIQEQLRQVGAQVDLDQLQWGSFLERQEAGRFDAALMSFNTDPSLTGARENWGTAGIGPQGQNALRYSNPIFDASMDSASAATDPERSRAHARRAFAAVVEDAPAIWLYDVILTAAVNRRITVEGTRMDGWWKGLADWSIPEDARIDRDRIGLAAGTP